MMSALEENIRKAEKNYRLRIMMIFIAVGAFAGVAGGLLYWTLSDLPTLNANDIPCAMALPAEIGLVTGESQLVYEGTKR